MATYRFVAYNIWDSLKQNNDDADINLRHILFWIQVVANKLRKQHLQKDLDRGAMLSVFDEVPIQIANKSQPPDLIEGRKYFDLPEAIMDLEGDQGIKYISYCINSGCCDEVPAWSHVQFLPITPDRASILYMNPYEEPTPSNPYFYRVRNRVYLLGLECISVQCLEVGLFTSIIPEEQCDLDDQIDIPDELISPLMFEVMNLGRTLLLIPQDRTNQGSDQVSQALTDQNVKLPDIQEAIPNELNAEE